MSLPRTKKKKVIEKHRTHDTDTGSVHVQVGLLTTEIDFLTKHLQEHDKDQAARRGLLGKVAQRRKLLHYLRLYRPQEYRKVLEANKMKK